MTIRTAIQVENSRVPGYGDLARATLNRDARNTDRAKHTIQMEFTMTSCRRFLQGSLCVMILLTLFGMTFSRVEAQNKPAFDSQTLDAYLEGQIRANHIPGLAVAVVQGDQVVFLRGYGEASAGRPMTAQTQLYIGSLTKSFTAMAAMQLIEQGKLELDAPVQRYLPWFQVADPTASAQITVRHLLNHTSGLSESGDPDASEYATTLEDQVRNMRDARLTAPVGSTYQYYNQNYQTMGLIVQQVSGQPFADYLAANVLKPLGMTHTVTDPHQAGDLAQGYGQAFGFPLPQDQAFRPGGLPSGYLITSAEDLSHYLVVQLNLGNYQGRQIVKTESMRQMHTPPAGIDSPYGMGWTMFRDPEFGNVIYHNGGLESFYAESFVVPDRNLAFAVLYNQGGLLRQMTANPVISSGLAELLIGKQPQPVSFAWIGWVLFGLMILDGLNHVRLFFTLSRWREKTARVSLRGRWLRALPGLVLWSLLLLGIPLIISAMLNGSMTWIGFWKDLYRILPDLTVWLFLGLALNVLLCSIRLFLILQLKPESHK